jgi:hypothetical protein
VEAPSTLLVPTATVEAADGYKIKNNTKTLNMTLKNYSVSFFHIQMSLQSDLIDVLPQTRYGSNT